MKLAFSKMHGAGNDFVVLDCTARGSKRGGPMSTVTWPERSMRGAITPAAVSTRISRLSVRPSSSTKRAKQRAPFPHCSTSPPSALKMR